MKRSFLFFAVAVLSLAVASCKLELSSPTVPVTGLSVSPETVDLEIGGQAFLTVDVQPSNATNKHVHFSSSREQVATVDEDGIIDAVSAGTAIITVKTDDGQSVAHCSVSVTESSTSAFVDLGLSVKWASCNIGASKPEEYGDYFAWGATKPLYEMGYAQEDPQNHWKSGYSEGYTWMNTPYQAADATNSSSSRWTKYLGSTTSKYKDASASDQDALKTVLDGIDDAANVALGGGWRMPTDAEWGELINTDNCSWTWETLNGVNGYKVQSKKAGYTGNWIFLPAAGQRVGCEIIGLESAGLFWCSSLYPEIPADGYCLIFRYDTGVLSFSHAGRNSGRSIRPVMK